MGMAISGGYCRSSGHIYIYLESFNTLLFLFISIPLAEKRLKPIKKAGITRMLLPVRK